VGVFTNGACSAVVVDFGRNLCRTQLLVGVDVSLLDRNINTAKNTT
jgi:hypothetical protein